MAARTASGESLAWTWEKARERETKARCESLMMLEGWIERKEWGGEDDEGEKVLTRKSTLFILFRIYPLPVSTFGRK